MKNVLFFLALSLTFSVTAQDDVEFKSEAIEFIKLTGATKAFDDAIDQIGGLVSAENKAAYKTEATATLDDLYIKMADLYMAEFTREEISKLVDFYKSDIGKKLAGKQVLLAQKGMVMGQSWGMKVQEIAQKYN